jgi:hypothetical protein
VGSWGTIISAGESRLGESYRSGTRDVRADV